MALAGLLVLASGLVAAALASAEVRSDPLLRRLHLPQLRPGQHCPVSPTHVVRPSYQTLIGRGPVYLIGVGGSGSATIDIGHSGRDGLGWYGQKTPWLVNRTYDGPILVRGARIDRRGEIRLAKEHSQHLRRLYWPTGADQGLQPDPHFRFLASETLFRTIGCYAYQIDGVSFSRIIVVRVRR